MKADLIIYNAAQLLTCASNKTSKKGAQMRDLGIIENGAAAILDGEIAGVGNSSEIFSEFESDNIYDAAGKTVTPGFIDCHTHLVYAGNRLDEFELKIKGADYLEILENGGGILSTVWQTRQASLEDLIEQSRPRLDKMLRHGVTTCEVKTGYGLDTETELKMLRAIDELDRTHPVDLLPTFLPAHAVPPEFKGKVDEYVELICEEMIPRAAYWWNSASIMKKYPPAHPLIITHFAIDVFCEKNAFNVEQSRRVLETGRKFFLNVKAHVDEFTNLGGTKMALELRAYSIDHLDQISDEEINLLARSGTIGVVTPAVNFNFGSKEFADARRMIDRGCAIAVSTDYNPGSAPCPSLPNALAIACRYQKLLPAEAVNAATINAACALGLGHRTGSLEKGKQADVLIFDTSDYREIVYEFGGNMIDKVIKNGNILELN